MKENDGMIIFGIVALAFIGFLFWRISISDSRTSLTAFTRDDQGRIKEILEREFK